MNQDLSKLDVTTTNGEVFTGEQSAMLAKLIWLRFGKDDVAATTAWRRLLGNDCSVGEFRQLREMSPE